MNGKQLHIVSFDVPYPPNYGGAIDVFYRLKALCDHGVEIVFHCFEYGRGKQPELEKYAQVHYYERKKSIVDGLSSLPFIVKSRKNDELLKRLLSDGAPILFEGLHTCYYIDDDELKNRVKIVRTHNIEHDYYSELANHSSGYKKLFFKSEAKKLKTFESQLKHATHIFAIKETDKKHFERYSSSVRVLPPCTHTLGVAEKVNTKPFCLFHGNLAVEENDNGAKWLVKNVFSNPSLNNTLKIAGNCPSKELEDLCKTHNVELIINPDKVKMDLVVNQARVHVFYTDQSTGVKLKLLNALDTSGHVVVNEKMIEGTKLGALCSVARTPEEFTRLIEFKLEEQLDDEAYSVRIKALQLKFNTFENCQKIVELI